MLLLICNIIKNVNSYRREPFGKSIHTEEEPHIYDFRIVSFIKTKFTKVTPCHTYWLKLLFCSQKLLVAKLLLIQCLNHLCSFCSIKLMLIFIKEQHLYLYLYWLRILGIQLRFLTSLVHVQHCSDISPTRLCYTLSWSPHQNMVTPVQLGF